MARLTPSERAKLPDSAFAYIDANGARRLPINDEAHVRAALGQFERVAFENDAARERARRRLLNAAKKHGIVPVGFITGQLRTEKASNAGDWTHLPTGSVTLVMSDIEGSTELLRSMGDGYASLLQEVRRIHRGETRKAGGHEIDVRADEYFACFEEPAAAIGSAVAIQRRMGERRFENGARVLVRYRDPRWTADAHRVRLRRSVGAHGCADLRRRARRTIVVSDRTREAVGEAIRGHPVAEPGCAPPERRGRAPPVRDPREGDSSPGSRLYASDR